MAPEVCLSVCPPANDNFTNAIAVTGYTGTTYGTNAGASSQPYEPILEGGGHQTVWYDWEAPSSGEVTFDLCLEASGFDSLLAAYTGSDVTALTEVAQNDDSCGSSSAISFEAAGGTTYSIQIDSFVESPTSPKERVEGVTGGTFYLHWNLPEPEYSLSAGDIAAAEGDGKTTYFDFTVTLSQASAGDVSVNWATSDGTAVQPDDYSASSGTAIVAAGELTTTFTVDVNGDLDHEADETFNVSLSEPDGAELGDATAVGTIENDDLAADVYLYYDTFGAKPKAGGWLNYMAQVYNSGGSDDAAVVVTLYPPENATYYPEYTYASKGSCAGDIPVVCSLGVLAAGESAYVVMYSSPSRTGIYRSSALVSSDLPDPDESDNSASTRSTVIPNGDGCTIVGTGEPDDIVGTTGDDVICALGGDDAIDGRSGDDIVRAGAGNDSVVGGPGYDGLYGEFGEDVITGGRDPDLIDGGSGFDTVSYSTSPGGVTVDLDAGTAVDGFAPLNGALGGGGESLVSVGAVVGSDFDDFLRGGVGHNFIFGSAGDDDLGGRSGHDTLDGGEGIDTLNGGVGRDVCTGETETNCER